MPYAETRQFAPPEAPVSTEPVTIWKPNTGPQYKFLACAAREVLYGGAAGGGKGLALDTPIPTPDGWKLMGELRPGDFVFAPDGTPARVEIVSDVKRLKCYELVFSDGSRVTCDEEHRWHVFTEQDRARLLRGSEEWRAQRRGKRAKRGIGARPDLAKLNSERKPALKPLAEGRVLDMPAMVAAHAEAKRPLSVRVASALKLPDADIPVDPYVLGAWLGDGNTAAGSFTIAEAEIVKRISAVYPLRRQPSMPWGYCAPGLATKLRGLGVIGKKRVPGAYLRGSESQRLELLRGLMDTDGHACENGAVEFSNMNRALADAVCELALSLGDRATVTFGRAMLRGKDCGEKYRVKWTPSHRVFHLTRKASAQRTPTIRTRWRYVMEIREVPTVSTCCIAVAHPSRCYLASRAMIPTHNTDGLLMGAIRFRDNPNMRAILFRKTFPMLAKIIDRSRAIYPHLGGRYNESKHIWRFPAGGFVRFANLDKPGAEENYQGDDFTYIGFDELTQWATAKQYTYMRSRLRSSAGSGITHLMIRGACNPGGRGHSWVKTHFGIDDAGNPADFIDTGTGNQIGTGFRRVFIPARLRDNPFLAGTDYERELMALPRDLRVALLDGRWDVVAGAVFGNYWNPRNWDDKDTPGNVCDAFDIPREWKIWRGADDGFNAPAACYWFAQHDERIFVVDELYREGMSPEAYAEEVLKRDNLIRPGERLSGVIDPQAFAKTGISHKDGASRGQIMNAKGCRWEEATKGPNSRVNDVSLVATSLSKVLPDGRRKVVVFRRCKNLIRTIPILPRDETNPEDVDSDSEDHAYDAFRYGLQWRRREIKQGKLTGL